MTIARYHLFEFNERPECPGFIRDSVVETLGTGLRWARMGDIVGPPFVDFLAASGSTRILDLCSGTGEPASLIVEWLAANGHEVPAFVLSDLFPNGPALAAAVEAHPAHLRAQSMPLDATRVDDPPLHEARTIINSFHHFGPEAATSILRDAVEHGASVFLYEGFTRNPLRLGATGHVMGPALMTNPFRARTQRWLKALFTYLIPLVPLAAMWDGFVSTLRVYSESELRGMVRPFGDGYTWEYREVPYPKGGLAVVFWGVPSSRLAVQGDR